MYSTIEEIRTANRKKGDKWFDDSSMRFFTTVIVSGVIKGKYFITSEVNPSGVKKYSVRMAESDGKVITVGRFHSYDTEKKAREAINDL
jgi:hypothetical protein